MTLSNFLYRFITEEHCTYKIIQNIKLHNRPIRRSFTQKFAESQMLQTRMCHNNNLILDLAKFVVRAKTIYMRSLVRVLGILLGFYS